MSEWVTSLQVNHWWLWYAKTHLSEPESRSILMTSWRGKFCVRVFLRHWSLSTSPITFSYIPLSPRSTHPPFSPPVLYARMLHARMYKNTYMLWYSTQTLGKNILCRNMIRRDMTDGSCWLLKRRGQMQGMLEWGGGVGGETPQVSNFQTELLLVKKAIYVKSLFWNRFIPSRLLGFTRGPEYKRRSQEAWGEKNIYCDHTCKVLHAWILSLWQWFLACYSFIYFSEHIAWSMNKTL